MNFELSNTFSKSTLHAVFCIRDPSQGCPDLGEVEDVEGDLAVAAVPVPAQLDGAEDEDGGRRDPGQNGALLDMI